MYLNQTTGVISKNLLMCRTTVLLDSSIGKFRTALMGKTYSLTNKVLAMHLSKVCAIRV